MITAEITKPRRRGHSPAITFRRILAPTDFSQASQYGLKCAQRFADEFGAELILLYVIEPLPSTTLVGIPGPIAVSGADFPAAEKNLRTLAQSTRNGLGERTECKIRTGVPSHEIVEAAKEADVDLIVIATHGYTGWKHFCIGSTAERVVRAAPCPVLTVREKEHEFC
jgi:nucleotide-binding universal stress UspA family protein